MLVKLSQRESCKLKFKNLEMTLHRAYVLIHSLLLFHTPAKCVVVSHAGLLGFRTWLGPPSTSNTDVSIGLEKKKRNRMKIRS